MINYLIKINNSQIISINIYQQEEVIDLLEVKQL